MNNTIEELVKRELGSIEQSFVDEPTNQKTLNVTTNLDEWFEVTKQNESFSKNTEGTGLNFDYEIIKNASGYILGPAFKYNGKTETVNSVAFNSLQEIKDFLKDKKYLLYKIVITIKSAELDEEAFTIKTLENPILVYSFRGHILE